MHGWQSKHIERLLGDANARALCGNDVVLLATDDYLGCRPRRELPGDVGEWFETEGIQYAPTALEHVRVGLASALPLVKGIPFVFLAPHEVRLASYDPGANALGEWLWTYSDN